MEIQFPRWAGAKPGACVLVAILLLFTVPVCGVQASSFSGDQTIAVYVDGRRLHTDVPPTLVSGRTLVPLRVIFEVLGARVDWKPENREVTAVKGDTSVTLLVGNRLARVNQQVLELDVAPVVLKGRTLVPVRFVSASLGAQVEWDGRTRRVTITSAAQPAQPQPGTGEADSLEVHFIDVGQGESILVKTPGGKVMLVDAGDAEAGEVVARYLKNQGVKKIDVFVASHADTDHLGGVGAIFKDFSVNVCYDTGFPHPSTVYEKFLDLIEDEGTQYRFAHAGNRIDLDPRLEVAIMHPTELLSDAHNNSIVLKISYGDVDILLTGDLEEEGERLLLDRGTEALAAEVLKVAHHGSTGSTSPELLDAVAPEVAVISVGAGNGYGYPAMDVMKRLLHRDILVYRTDRDGTVIIRSDGRGYTVETGQDPGGGEEPP